ncbi:unnamed protein product [Fusarium graminearum]|nr:unnamed protein product [Fusarium graminearum]CAG1989749.1 unnamed protein product [Fusarium graminearum]
MDEPKKPGRPSSFNEPPIWSRSKANLAKPSCLSSNPHVFRSIGIHAVAKDNGLRHKMRGNLNPALDSQSTHMSGIKHGEPAHKRRAQRQPPT